MSEHFCNCFVLDCQHHPKNHGQGCDPCIQKNLREGEIPSCFWLRIGADMTEVKKANLYTFDAFVNYYQQNREQYLKNKS